MDHISEHTQGEGKREYFRRMKNKLEDSPATSKSADRGLLAIRIGLGAFFIYHGLGKFFGFAPDGGIEAVTGMLTGIGFFLPVFWAYFLAFVELFGGIAIILGFLTRISSIFLAVISIVAFVTVKDFAFGGAGDLDVLSFAMALALVLAGPGKIAFAEKWYQEEMAATTDNDETVSVEVTDNNPLSTTEKTEEKRK